MRYAISAYTFDDLPLPDSVTSFAEMGFDTISFTHRTLLNAPPGEAAAAAMELEHLNLAATVHAQFDLTEDGLASIVDTLGETLIRLTFDSARREDSRGTFFDVETMSTVLAMAAKCIGPRVRYGVEDFPLDAHAVDYYRDGLEPMLADERFGVLIDLGHMNLRRERESHFAAQSEAAYMAAVPLDIIEVHVHDNRGYRDDHAPIGWGMIDFAAAAAGLAGAGFDGISTIEICPPFHGSTSKQSRPACRESLDEWKSLCEGNR